MGLFPDFDIGNYEDGCRILWYKWTNEFRIQLTNYIIMIHDNEVVISYRDGCSQYKAFTIIMENAKEFFVDVSFDENNDIFHIVYDKQFIQNKIDKLFKLQMFS